MNNFLPLESSNMKIVRLMKNIVPWQSGYMKIVILHI